MLNYLEASIGRKFNYTVTFTTGFALCIACGAFVLADISLLREHMARNILVLAKLTGTNSSGALIFEDKIGAKDILMNLDAEPHVVSAALYTSDDQLMVRYFRKSTFPAKVPERLPEEYLGYEDNQLIVVHRLKFDGEAIGGIYIASDLKEVEVHAYHLIKIIAIISIVTLIFSVFLSTWIQKKLVRPILALTKLVNKVAKDNDFSLRATKTSNDELGVVMDGFNVMLDQINHFAFYDHLTNLANRHTFNRLLDSSLILARRNKQRLAVIFLDLDNFKRINDTLGHGIGDLLLKTEAKRLLDCVRGSDYIARIGSEKSSGDRSVARFGGDEFAVLINDIRHPKNAGIVADRILAALSIPVLLDGYNVFTTPSIGIAIFPDDGEDADILLKNADTAMYQAKKEGKGSFRLYHQDMNANAHKRLSLEEQLRKALERGEISLHYQPLINGYTGKIKGAEALMRWENSVFGTVSPIEFIPIAEEIGLITKLGEWALLTACRQAKYWSDQGLKPFQIAVNLSSVQFHQDGLVGIIENVLVESGLAAENLVLELTESLVMKDSEKSIGALNQLKTMGLQLAVDDFGTGYSSLSYLKRFPIDYLKIDRSFIKDVTTNLEDASITTAIITLAHSLNLQVVAEGVETIEQEAFLKGKGCDKMQGYLYSKPMASSQFEQYYKAHTKVLCKLLE